MRSRPDREDPLSRTRETITTAALLGTIAALLGLLACAQDRGDAGTPAKGEMPLYDNLGSHSNTITVSDPASQDYFNQGLRLLYAFNHTESARAFAEGEWIDSTCAMCAWGIALALSPNINDPADSARMAGAYQAIQRAVQRMGAVSDREQGYIRAMAARFAPVPSADRAALDTAYANGMRTVADQYPDDSDAQVLYADALMNLSPWYYWESDGSPRPATLEILDRLERAMALAPQNPGACHLFIHAVEAHDPRRAVDCAERLAALMPGAGHIVHMPGHIYIRVGRYVDAIEQNKHAVHADESFLEGPHITRRGIYPQGYYPHNYHFMGFAASMAGQSETAIYAARQVAEKLSPEVALEIGWLEAVTPFLYWTLVTFSRWDEILAEPMPVPQLRFAAGQAYYARGMAYAAKEQFDDALAALDSVTAIAESWPENDNKTALLIAQHALAGEIALRDGEAERAVGRFRLAVELEDQLTYNEPPTWYYPMRQSLGKALLAAGDPEQAERVYRDDLSRFPDNGWSLYGLYLALSEQGKAGEADSIKERFDEAWASADVELTASRF